MQFRVLSGDGDLVQASKMKTSPKGIARKHSLLRWLSALDEVFGWYYGATLNEMKVTRKQDGWLLIVKVTKGSKHLVAFFNVETILDGLESLANGISHHNIAWKEDQYPPNVGA